MTFSDHSEEEDEKKADKQRVLYFFRVHRGPMGQWEQPEEKDPK